MAINGFGRIGRQVLRVALERNNVLDIVSVNDLTDAKTLAHLFKYDSVHGKFKGEIAAKEHSIVVNGKEIEVTAVKDPAELKWSDKGVEVVIESTGVFRKKDQCMKHVAAGAKKVILTVPPKDEIDNMIVLGVNEGDLKASDVVVSNASCTTNCLAPMIRY